MATKGEDGFVALDALMALTILSTTLALAIVGALTAVRLTTSARETRQAQALLSELLLTGPAQPGDYRGQAGAMAWRLQVDKLAADTVVPLCYRAARATVRGSPRRFSMFTLRECPTVEPAP